MTVWFKMGVVGDLVPRAQKGFGRVCQVYFNRGLDVFVTSIREANHMPGSFHYIGRAFDVKSRGVPKSAIEAALGTGWQVIEYPKLGIFHCELDDT